MAVFRWKDAAGDDVYVKFDAVTVVELSRETDITEHPVEDGPDVSDHVRARLPRVAVTAFMSNTPLYSNDRVEEIADWESIDLPRPTKQVKLPSGGVSAPSSDPDSIGQAVRNEFSDAAPTKVFGLVFNDFRSRVREVREKLDEVQENGYLISLEDTDGDFDNLAIERASSIRSLEDGNGATFTLEAKQLRLTTSETVDAPEPAELRGQATKNLGAQATKKDPNSEEKKAKMKSILKTLYDGATSG